MICSFNIRYRRALIIFINLLIPLALLSFWRCASMLIHLSRFLLFENILWPHHFQQLLEYWSWILQSTTWFYVTFKIDNPLKHSGETIYQWMRLNLFLRHKPTSIIQDNVLVSQNTIYCSISSPLILGFTIHYKYGICIFH